MPTPEPERLNIAAAPIIVTATMGAAVQAWADRLRRLHYPAERNRLPAHITLFHHLPPSCERALRARLADLALRPPPRARLMPPFSLGHGAAFRIESPELMAMRAEIATHFQDSLIPQDAAPPRLHITVQNKVSADQARATLAALAQQFTPRDLAIQGLAAWRYLGGPWAPIAHYSSRGNGGR